MTLYFFHWSHSQFSPVSRISLKIVGASGQGIDSIGNILAKGLKRSGYCVFGYREYPSLIKGGHASYQLDISVAHVESTETEVDLLFTLNHHGLQLNLRNLKPGGVIIHQTANWKFKPAEQAVLDERKIRVVYLPVEETLARLKAKPILGNVFIAAFVWAALGREIDTLKEMVGERFAKKKDLLAANMQCIDEGYGYTDAAGKVTVAMPPPRDEWKNHLVLRGAEAMGMGAIHAGVRLYVGYPMTPSSPILTYVASVQNETGMAIKQAEDEITAAQMASGAMHMGTRALTATAGGGFDLMTETLSLNGLIENPTVFIVAQRPGPATGLPTWTAQGDLLMTVHAAHGEFPRCVLGVSDAQDSFALMNEAFNLAEEFQLSVIVLTEKQITEALYTQIPFDQSKAEIRRGTHLVNDAQRLAALKSADRYDPHAGSGVSPRWLPGALAATYNAQGDEHSGDGSIDESAGNAVLQMEKRMRKLEALKSALPEPEVFGAGSDQRAAISDADIGKMDVLLVGWGSTKSVMLDALQSEELKGKKIGYLHFTYLWPLKTGRLQVLAARAKKVVLVEGNYQGQLGVLIRQECGLDIRDRILKYDGRPFFYDELVHAIGEQMAKKSPTTSSLVSRDSVAVNDR